MSRLVPYRARRVRGVLALALVSLLATAVAAAAQPTGARPPAATSRPAAPPAPVTARPAGPRPLLAKLPPIQTFTLANGLSAAVVTVETVPSVAIGVWYRAGSKDEPRDRRGLAQIVSRLMWKGSGRVRPEAHAGLIAALGGRVTGATDEDSTYFGTELPAAYLDFALSLEAERMRGLQLRDGAVAAEAKQLAAELRQEDSSPIARGLRRLLELAFTKHPYAWPAGGVVADLEKITAADAKRYYDAYYVPGNAMIVVVGAVGADQVRASLDKHFGALPSSPVTRPASASDEPAPTAQRREVAAPGPLGLVLVGYQVPAAQSPDWAALQLGAAILAGDSGRLKQRLRVGPPKDLGLDAGVTATPREHPSALIALAVFSAAQSAQALEAAVLDEVGKLALRGPTAEELRVAKTQLLTRSLFALEPASGLATGLGRAWISHGDPKALLAEVDRIDATKPEDVRRVLSTYLRADRATILVVPPAAKAAKP